MVYHKPSIIALTFILWLIAGLAKAEPFVFTTAWTAQAQFAGYYIAKEKGFYKQTGLFIVIQHPSLTSSVVNRFVSPIKALANQAQMMAEGQFDGHLKHTKRIDETGQLQNSFLSMQESIANYISDLEHVKTETEQRNQELIIAKNKAEEADHKKAAFIQDLSHQIRTLHEHVFSQFTKLDDFSEGLGMGLTLCRKLAGLLGGHITLDAAYTKGARFVLTLPVSPVNN